MAIPDATLTIRDGGLGLADAGDNGVVAHVGASSNGTVGTVYTFNDVQTLKDTLGTGPLPEAMAHVLAVAGGPVVGVRATSAGSAVGATSATKSGTAALATSGTALDAFDAQVVIVQAGTNLAAGTATFKYSLDGARTWSAEISVPVAGTYVIPGTGVTLTWTDGTFIAGDKWVFTSAAPTMALGDVQTAIDALLADVTADFFLVHVVGAAASVAASATMFAAIESKLQSAASTNYRYVRGIIEAPDDTDTNMKSAFVAAAGTRTMVGAGSVYLVSQLSGVAYKRNAAWVAAARAALVPPSEDLGRVRTGPAVGVHSLVRDEYKTPSLDAAGFTTLRTHPGRSGYYVTNGRILASPGSDYRYLQYGRVVDIACKAIRSAQLDFLNDAVKVSSSTGRIIEEDARNVEANVEAKVRAAVTEPGYASNIQVTLDRTTNVLSTQKMVMRYRITPLAYAKTIEGEVALYNPAVQPV
jgi:hypothetical protein